LTLPPQRLSSFEVRPQLSENRELRKRLAALEMQYSRAVSYLSYCVEKDAQLCISVWTPPDRSRDDLPRPLLRKVPVGNENMVVKPFWKNSYGLIPSLKEFRMVTKWEQLAQRLPMWRSTHFDNKTDGTRVYCCWRM
jgi:hypothetical protein